MEFYRDKKIDITMETKLIGTEIVDRLSPYIEPRIPWYKFQVFATPGPRMKNYVGVINKDKFRIISKDYLLIEGNLNKKDNRSLITLMFRDYSPSWEGWLGSMPSAILITGAYLVFGLIAMKAFLNFQSIALIISIEILILGLIISQMVRINRTQTARLSEKTNEHIKFLKRMLEAE